MARIAGVEIPNKRIEVALTYIYGIGRSSARLIGDKAEVERNKRINDVSEADINKVRKIIESEYRVEGELRNQINASIKRLLEINCYRGMRHRQGLPSRGQRTRTNARTRKGKVKTVANKKIARKG